jgi:hypothetical protein
MVDRPPSVGTLRDCSRYSNNAASVNWRMSVSVASLDVEVYQPTKVPDPPSGASRAPQAFNLADCRIFSGQLLASLRVLMEYHSATSARIARLANSFAFARPIHSSGHRSKKLNISNTSVEGFSIGRFAEEFGLMQVAISFGEIDSSEAVCSLINAKLASIRESSAAGYKEVSWGFLPRKLLNSQKIAERSNLHTTCPTVIPEKTSFSVEGSLV